MMKDNFDKILITGSTSMVGSHVVHKLIANEEYKNNLRLFLRKTSKHPHIDDLNIERVYGDLRDYESVEKAVSDCKKVIHIAGYFSYRKKDAHLLFETNCKGTENIVNACVSKGIDKLVFISAVGAIGMGNSINPVTEDYIFEDKYKYIDYMWSKKLAEEVIRHAVREHSLDATIINPGSIYGSGDIFLNTGRLIVLLAKKRIPFAPPGGTSVVAASDVAQGIILAMEKGTKGKRYILTTEHLSYKEIFNVIAAELGVPPVKYVIPKNLTPALYATAYALERVIPSYGRAEGISSNSIKISSYYRYFDSSKARRELGWAPQMSFRAAIREAIEFYKSISVI